MSWWHNGLIGVQDPEAWTVDELRRWLNKVYCNHWPATRQAAEQSISETSWPATRRQGRSCWSEFRRTWRGRVAIIEPCVGRIKNKKQTGLVLGNSTLAGERIWKR
jgi:hypothetical protein